VHSHWAVSRLVRYWTGCERAWPEGERTPASEMSYSPHSGPHVPSSCCGWLVQRMALPKLSPGSMAAQFRENLLPVLAEITVLTTKLSMSGDQGLRDASRRVSSAAALLLEHGFGKAEQQPREDELKAALQQLRDARDLAATPWWNWRESRKLRSGATPAALPPGRACSQNRLRHERTFPRKRVDPPDRDRQKPSAADKDVR
jgi:hypothetical protein